MQRTFVFSLFLLWCFLETTLFDVVQLTCVYGSVPKGALKQLIREAIMLDGGFDQSIQKQAKSLAVTINFSLVEHNAAAYDLLLRGAVAKGITEDSADFQNVAGKLYNHLYGLSKPENRTFFALTTLQVVHTVGRKVGSVEEYSELPKATLAKMKAGDDYKLTLLQIAFLGCELAVPVSLLCEDYSDRPEDLKKDLVDCGALTLGDRAADSGAINQPDEAVGPELSDADIPASDTPLPEAVSDDVSVSAPPLVESEADVQTGEDAASTEVPDSLYEKAVQWSTDGLHATWGDRSFDLTSKDFRKKLIGHIRAAVVQAKITFSAVIEVGDFGKRSTSWFSGVEKGQGRMYGAEIEQIAKICEVPAAVLLTGKGLDPTKMAPPVSSAKGSSQTSVIPSIPQGIKTDWFKSRTLRKGVEMADGYDKDDLFAYALDANNPEHDWEAIWFEKTAEGASVQAYISKVAGEMNAWGSVMRSVAMDQLLESLFPSEE